MQSVFLATISLDGMAGGLEKNILLLANYLAKKKFNVHLITFDTKLAEAFYDIGSNVAWHKVGLGKPHDPISFVDRIKVIMNTRMAIKRFTHDNKKPIIICFHHGILARFFLATLFVSAQIICSERNSLSLYNHIKKRKWNVNFALLSFVKKIVIQFPNYALDYPFWMQGRIVSIANPVASVSARATPNFSNSKGRFTILTVGRLSTQKQQDLLVLAFALLANKYPKWDLLIVGDGSMRLQLERLIRKQELNQRVLLVGKSTNVAALMQKSHIFCFPSQWEGFPNALGEAMANGLPSVGFKECEGVNRLIDSGVNGLLVPGKDNELFLAEALETLIKDDNLRLKMGREASNTTRQFKPQKVLSSWVELIERLVGNK